MRIRSWALALCTTLAGVTAGVPQAAAAPAPATEAGGSVPVLAGVSATRYLPQPDGDHAEPEPQAFRFTVRPGAAEGAAGPVRVRIGVGALDGVATLGELDEHCHYGDDHAHVDCAYTASPAGTEVTPFTLAMADGGAPGDHGTVQVTASGSAGGAAEASARVWAGLPQLHTSAALEKGLQPAGGTATVRMSVRNSGKVPAADGFGITVDAGNNVALTHLARNCGRTTDPGIGVCRFDGRALAPGETVALESPLDLHVPEHLLHTTLDLYAWASKSADDPRLPEISHHKGDRYYGHWRQGEADSPAVGVRKETGARRGFEKYPRLWIHTDAHLDVSAVAGTISGREGESVDVPIRVAEHWPDGGGGSPVYVSYTYRFTAPEGTTVLHGPTDSGDPMCEGAGRVLSCSGNMTGDFITLRIDRKVPHAAARVEIVQSRTLSARDPVRANDSATLPLHVTGVTPGLRARRIASAAAPWAAGGAALLAAGGTLYWWRGRRARRPLTG